MIKVIGVRFRRAGKVYYFNPLDMDITTGMHVIVETARGVEYGYVVLGVKDMDEYDKYLFWDYDYVSAPIYLWPFTPNVMAAGGFTNGYGFKQE